MNRFALASMILGACLALGSFFVAPSVSQAQSRQIIDPEGYIDLEGLWPAPFQISVCWERGTDDYRKDKEHVQNAVKKYIQGVSSVLLYNWGECKDEDLGIRVRIADEQPRSAVGRQWARDPKTGERLRDGFAQFIERPTVMILNFSFKRAFLRCDSMREHCIAAIAVHEFLHALGFLHEQLRSDAPVECKESFAHVADFTGFQPVFATQDYDPDSHMNYCASGSIYREPMTLSKGDIAMLRKFYTLQ